MTKIEELVQDKCKDMGLSKNAIDALIQSMGGELNGDSTEEEIEAVVERIANVAKAMQGEATRWANKVKKDEGKKDDPKKDEGKKDDESMEAIIAKAVAAAVTPLQEQLNNLTGAAIATRRKEQLTKELEGVNDSLRAMVMDAFEHRTFESDEEFEAYVKKTSDSVKSISDDMASAGLRNHAAPRSAKNAEGVSAGVQEYVKAATGEGGADNLGGKKL